MEGKAIEYVYRLLKEIESKDGLFVMSKLDNYYHVDGYTSSALIGLGLIKKVSNRGFVKKSFTTSYDLAQLVYIKTRKRVHKNVKKREIKQEYKAKFHENTSQQYIDLTRFCLEQLGFNHPAPIHEMIKRTGSIGKVRKLYDKSLLSL